MAHINIEFKARVSDAGLLEERFRALAPVFRGEDTQCDTYFNVPKGRLKLREGNIENALIFYERQDVAGSKQSTVQLYKHAPDPSLKELLTRLHGIKTIVRKIRRIYFIDNVKFHFDKIEGLGEFVEVEAIDADGSLGLEKITEQCNYYAAYFSLQPGDYIADSYSDMIGMNTSTP